MLVPLNQWIPWKTLTFHARSRRERGYILVSCARMKTGL